MDRLGKKIFKHNELYFDPLLIMSFVTGLSTMISYVFGVMYFGRKKKIQEALIQNFQQNTVGSIDQLFVDMKNAKKTIKYLQEKCQTQTELINNLKEKSQTQTELINNLNDELAKLRLINGTLNEQISELDQRFNIEGMADASNIQILQDLITLAESFSDAVNTIKGIKKTGTDALKKINTNNRGSMPIIIGSDMINFQEKYLMSLIKKFEITTDAYGNQVLLYENIIFEEANLKYQEYLKLSIFQKHISTSFTLLMQVIGMFKAAKILEDAMKAHYNNPNNSDKDEKIIEIKTKYPNRRDNKNEKLFNFYNILNLNKDASEDDIKESYKTLSYKYHPDRNGDSPESTAKQAQINLARDVLLKKRSIYDQYYDLFY